MQIRSGKATGTISAYSNLEVEISRKVPVWNGVTWVTQRNRKAVSAALDVLRNRTYGYGADDSKIDLATFYHYATTVTTYDTFDGTIRGPVPVFGSAPDDPGRDRGEPTLDGRHLEYDARRAAGHPQARHHAAPDRARFVGRRVRSRLSDGSSDIIVEWFSVVIRTSARNIASPSARRRSRRAG